MTTRPVTVWNQLRSEAERVVDVSARLPAVVHRLPLLDAPFFDGDAVFSEVGWALASSLARLHGDPKVNLIVVDPEPEYFLDAIGEYGAFSCDASDAVECYLAGLFGDGSNNAVGQIGYTAETVAIFGMSGRWGIWVERNVAGLVASVKLPGLAAYMDDHGLFLAVDDALEDLLGLNLGDTAASSQFSDSLRRNYSVIPLGPR